MAYTEEIPSFMEEADIYTIEDFIAAVKSGAFTDYDGFGHPLGLNNKMDGCVYIKPSRLDEIPHSCRRIVWFNR